MRAFLRYFEERISPIPSVANLRFHPAVRVRRPITIILQVGVNRLCLRRRSCRRGRDGKSNYAHCKGSASGAVLLRRLGKLLSVLLSRGACCCALVFCFRFILIFVDIRIQSGSLIAFLRTAGRFCVFRVAISRLRFTFRRLISICSGRFMFSFSRVVEEINGTRRVIFRDVRRVSVNLRAKAGALVVIFLRLSHRESRTILQREDGVTSHPIRFFATSLSGHLATNDGAISMNVNGLAFSLRVERIKGSYRLHSLTCLQTSLIIRVNRSHLAE